jgi:hypothetical protein
MEPLRLPIVRVNDPEIERLADGKLVPIPMRKVYSNLLSQLRAWDRLGTDPSIDDEEFLYFFEDDVALHPALNASEFRGHLKNVERESASEKFFYCGICGPTWLGPGYFVSGTPVRRGFGSCVHAYAIKKAYARVIIAEKGIDPSKHPYLDVQLSNSFRSNGNLVLFF